MSFLVLYSTSQYAKQSSTPRRSPAEGFSLREFNKALYNLYVEIAGSRDEQIA